MKRELVAFLTRAVPPGPGRPVPRRHPLGRPADRRPARLPRPALPRAAAAARGRLPARTNCSWPTTRSSPVKRDLQGRGRVPGARPRTARPGRRRALPRPGLPRARLPARLGRGRPRPDRGQPAVRGRPAPLPPRPRGDRRAGTTGGRWSRPVPDAAAEMPESVRGLIRRKLDQLDPADRRLLAAASVQGRGVRLGGAGPRPRRRPGGRRGAAPAARTRSTGWSGWCASTSSPTGRCRGGTRSSTPCTRTRCPPNCRRPAGRRSAGPLADALLALQNGQPGLAAAELALLYEAGRDFGRAADLFHAAAQNAARVFAHREAAALARRGLGLLRGPARHAGAGRPGVPPADGAGAPAPGDRGVRRAGGGGGLRPGPRAVGTRARRSARCSRSCGGCGCSTRCGRTSAGRTCWPASCSPSPSRPATRPWCSRPGRPARWWPCARATRPPPAGTWRPAVALYDPAPAPAPDVPVRPGPRGGVPGVRGGRAVAARASRRRRSARSRDAVRLARDGSQPSTLALALHFAAVLHQFRGDPAAVREFAAEALAVAVEHRFAFWQAGATVLLGWAAAAGGGTDGTAVLEQGIEAWRATGSETYRAYYLGLLADARGRRGRPDDALAALGRGGPGGGGDRGAAVRAGGPPAARGVAGGSGGGRGGGVPAAAVAAARDQQARALELRAAVGLGRFLGHRGRPTKAGRSWPRPPPGRGAPRHPGDECGAGSVTGRGRV